MRIIDGNCLMIISSTRNAWTLVYDVLDAQIAPLGVIHLIECLIFMQETSLRLNREYKKIHVFCLFLVT